MTKFEASMADARTATRESLLLSAKVKRGDEAARRVIVRNLSAAGVMVEGFEDLQVDDAVVADIPGLGKIVGTIAWTESGRAGLAFAGPVDPTLVRRPRLRAV